MDQPALDNKTDFAVHPQMLLDRDGEKLVAVVKATFELPPASPRGPLELAPKERARGVRFADVPWGKPEVASVAYPSDLCLRKPGTDVLLVGRAFAPGGVAVPSFDVLVQVGHVRKALRVFGLRVWEAGGSGISAARPVAKMDLRYDNAWGGTDDSDPGKLVEEARNPVGMGVARDPATLTHKPAPHIEDPDNLLRSWRTRPPPAGVGPVGRSYDPRRRWAGTYDAAWQETRAPLPPDDLDDRFHHCASPGLVADPPLRGDELVTLLNVVPNGGPTTFGLPRVAVSIAFLVRDRAPELVVPHLDTVLIDTLDVGPDAPVTVELCWRAAVKAPRRMKDARVVVRELELPR